MCVGAIASGGVGRANQLDSYWYLTAWCSSFSFVLGLFTLSLFAFLAGVYLCVQADNTLLKNDFRIRSLWTAAVTAILGFAALFLVDRDVPRLRTGLLGRGTSNFFMALTVMIALIAVLALSRRSYRIARLFAMGQVALILWGWAASQYPLIVPPDMTLSMAAAPPNLLHSLLAALIAGLIILVPSLWYLYHVFELPARAPREQLRR
jgi:cytochrome d ubiquinol oxidase subunit II